MTGGHISRRTYRRPDGTTYTRYRARYPNPQARGATSKKIERVFATKKEARRWLQTEQAKLQRGEWVDPALATTSFAAVAQEWRRTWPLDGLAPKTRGGYDAILRKHALPEFGDAPVAQVKADAIQDYLGRLAEDRAPNTVKRIFTVTRQVFAVAVERNYIGVNPCDGVRLGRVRKRPETADADEKRYVTERQAQDLATSIDARYRTFVLTAAYTGARAGELRALRRRDYNALKQQLDIRRSVSEVSAELAQEEARDGAEVYGNLVFKSTKTYERRRVTLPEWLAGELEKHLETRPSDPAALIFATAEGRPIRQSNFLRRFWYPAVKRRYCADCDADVGKEAERCPECDGAELVYVLSPELHNLRFHDLRHSHASWLIAKGAPAGHLMKRLGHKDIRTTFNTYGHLYPSDEEALAGLFEAPAPETPATPDNVTELRAAAAAANTE